MSDYVSDSELMLGKLTARGTRQSTADGATILVNRARSREHAAALIPMAIEPPHNPTPCLRKQTKPKKKNKQKNKNKQKKNRCWRTALSQLLAKRSTSVSW